MADLHMKTTVKLVLLALCIFAVLVTARGCRDRMKTISCQRLVQVYRVRRTDSCKWRSMKTNCAKTCNQCVPKPRCTEPGSKYGCCWDNKTEATGYSGQGCPECKDRYSNWCRTRISRFSKARACNKQGKKFCPKSCNVCSALAPAQAVPDCVDSPYGCCWDHTSAQGPQGEGCRVCEDLYNNLCRFWSEYCKPVALKSISKKVIKRYRLSCPVTCRKCRKGQKMLDRSSYLPYRRGTLIKTT